MTVAPDEAVAVLLALPGVTEADHHGRRSFRVGAAEWSPRSRTTASST